MKEINKENKVKSLVDVSLEKIRELIDVNCVIGDLVTLPDDSAIIPITKVSVGFVAGGGEYNDLNSKRNDADFPMAGGTGGGYTVSPIGFFVIKDNKFKLINADKTSAYLNLIKTVAEAVQNINKK
ncbi:MAG: sporulation protein YtfJ [Clostridia bacterium]|nr:sporulation protein YtfJ [Clostridia bacterium]